MLNRDHVWPLTGIALIGPASQADSEAQVIAVQQLLEKRFQVPVIYGEDTYKKLTAKERAEHFLAAATQQQISVLWADTWWRRQRRYYALFSCLC